MALEGFRVGLESFRDDSEGVREGLESFRVVSDSVREGLESLRTAADSLQIGLDTVRDNSEGVLITLGKGGSVRDAHRHQDVEEVPFDAKDARAHFIDQVEVNIVGV